MRFSKPKQFWNWFQRNKDTYYNVLNGTKRETYYHMREMTVHLMVYGKHINAELYWHQNKENLEVELLFTTYGRPRDFRKVERLVAAAPYIPGWRFLELNPPRPVDYFMEEDFGGLGIDPFQVLFDPAYLDADNRKQWLQVYVDCYTELIGEHTKFASAVAYNVLGERTYGLCIARIEVRRLIDLPSKRRADLVNIQQLPRYISLTEHSNRCVDVTGNIQLHST